MAGKDTNTGAKRARELREELGLDATAPLACILGLVEERLGLPVGVVVLPEAVAGVCWRGEGDAVVLWVNGTQATVRCRFTLAHELGHVRCGHDHAIPVERYETLSGKSTDAREVQANAFAAELLMPKAGVLELAPEQPSLEDVVRLAAPFGTSPIAMLYRLSTLRVVRGERYERLKREIEEGLDEELRAALALPEVEDGLAELDPRTLPRLPRARTENGLESLARHDAPLADVAAAAGCDPAQLAAGERMIGL
jgi:Zn-dependent peptidase ImmA (M78 family)